MGFGSGELAEAAGEGAASRFSEMLSKLADDALQAVGKKALKVGWRGNPLSFATDAYDAFKKNADEVENRMLKVAEMSDRLGVGKQAILSYAAGGEATGLSLDDVGGALKRLNSAMARSQTDEKTRAAIANLAGMEPAELAGKGTEAVFEGIASRMGQRAMTPKMADDFTSVFGGKSDSLLAAFQERFHEAAEYSRQSGNQPSDEKFDQLAATREKGAAAAEVIHDSSKAIYTWFNQKKEEIKQRIATESDPSKRAVLERALRQADADLAALRVNLPGDKSAVPVSAGQSSPVAPAQQGLFANGGGGQMSDLSREQLDLLRGIRSDVGTLADIIRVNLGN